MSNFERYLEAVKDKENTFTEKHKQFVKMGFSKRQATDLCETGVSIKKVEDIFDNSENAALDTIGGIFKFLMGGMSKEELKRGKEKFKADLQKD